MSRKEEVPKEGSGIQVVIVVFTGIAVAISALALYVSFLGYLARNRPYVGVSLLGVRGEPDEEKIVDITLKNMGSVPAIDVMINVSYYSVAISESRARLGVIFPGSDASIAIPVEQGFFYFLSEEEETTLENSNVVVEFPDPLKGVGVYCRITYRQAPVPILDWAPSYRTYQPLRVTSDGRWYPSDSEPAELT
jgi:hypothetical protein